MKVTALTLLIVGLASLAQAAVDYQLKCSRDEVGIRWPSYHSNSEYYVCQRENGKQLKIVCQPGEVFTFVLQMCSSPSKFIPPPPMDILPTASPIIAEPSFPGGSMYPQPWHPEITNPMQPPFLPPSAPEVTLPEEEPLPGLPASNPQVPSNTDVITPPLPPTPPPTPPSHQAPKPPKKTPPRPAGSAKKPPAPPSAGKKQPPAPTSTGKKQPPAPPGRKQPPVPPKKQVELPKAPSRV